MKKKFNLPQAKRFVTKLDLSNTPRGLLSMSAATEASALFDQAKAQAQVVGSALFSFTQGVEADVREAISDSALLAQLVANKQVSVENAPLDWFAAYSKVLQTVGWTLQDGGWTDYTAQGTAGEVHAKIIEVMTVALGPAPAALAIVAATVDALKGMNANSSWMTIFRREVEKAKIARFQIGLVEKNRSGNVFVSLLACLIEAKKSITQVLFFKFKNSQASFKANTAKVSINRGALRDLGPIIRGKVRAYQAGYLSSILDI
jgi:hypothetical protein